MVLFLDYLLTLYWFPSTSLRLHSSETRFQKEYGRCADTAFGICWLWPQHTVSKDMHSIEGNNKVPKGKSKIGFGEVRCSKTEAKLGNRMWKKKCGKAVEQYPEIYVRYCQWFGLENQQENNNTELYRKWWVQEMIEESGIISITNHKERTAEDLERNWKNPYTRPRKNILKAYWPRPWTFKEQDVMM